MYNGSSGLQCLHITLAEVSGRRYDLVHQEMFHVEISEIKIGIRYKKRKKKKIEVVGSYYVATITGFFICKLSRPELLWKMFSFLRYPLYKISVCCMYYTNF